MAVNPKEALDWMREFESKSEALNYSVAGVDCWPVIRNTMLSMLLPRSSRTDAMGFKHIPHLFFGVIRSLKDMILLKKADFFVLTDIKFSVDISNSIYLKDAHAIAQQAASEYEESIIALQNFGIDKRIVGRENCRSVYSILFISALISRLTFVLYLIPGLSEYLRSICQSLSLAPMLQEISVSERKLRRQIWRNVLFSVVASKLFSRVLAKVNPRKVFVVCYYSALGMSLCAACRKLKIPVADIQHGVAGSNMRAYAAWSRIPKEGYSTLPTEFYCWTKFDAKAVDEWAAGTSIHRSIVVGSLWRDFVKKEKLLRQAENEWSDFFKMTSSYEKRILITMQSDHLSEMFAELISRPQARWGFFIRMHPGFPLKENYIKSFSSFKNVYIEEPSKIPLQLLMKHVDFHLTEWSGAVVDAYFEGVRSVVISEQARYYFYDYILEGSVVYAATASEVADILG